MARYGETAVTEPGTGRAFSGLLEYTHWRGFLDGYKRKGLTPPSTLEDVARVEPLVAHISRDAWVVDCPNCGGADNVFSDAPLLWCHECGNAAVGGTWRPVRLPPDAAAIEAVLSKRPMIQQRSWTPRETVADLKADNEAHGVPV